MLRARGHWTVGHWCDVGLSGLECRVHDGGRAVVAIMEVDDLTKPETLVGSPLPDVPLSFTLYLHDVVAGEVSVAVRCSGMFSSLVVVYACLAVRVLGADARSTAVPRRAVHAAVEPDAGIDVGYGCGSGSGSASATSCLPSPISQLPTEPTRACTVIQRVGRIDTIYIPIF